VETKSFEMPALYADHHVTEVRRILMDLDGVKEVYASSAFQVVEVTYDEDKINELEIASRLDESGYLGEWTIPIELGTAAQQGDGQKPYFRHTTTFIVMFVVAVVISGLTQRIRNEAVSMP